MDEKEPARPPNADQLRSAIDSGATGDKVKFPDPAAAPLGTDAEAGGGASPSGTERALAVAAEAGRASPGAGRHRPRALPLALIFLALIAVSAIITFIVLGS